MYVTGYSTGNPIISMNFDRINAVRPVIVVQDGVGLPFSFKSVTNLNCTPDQAGN